MDKVSDYIQHLSIIYENSPNPTFLIDKNLNILWQSKNSDLYFNIFCNKKLNLDSFSTPNNIIIDNILNKEFFTAFIYANNFNKITTSFYKVKDNLFIAIIATTPLINDNNTFDAFNKISNNFREIISSNDIVYNAINKVFTKINDIDNDIYIDRLVRNNFRLLRQVNNMSIFSKIQNGIVEPFSYINIKKFLTELFTNIKSIIPNSLNIPIVFTEVQDDFFSFVNPEYLTIAISNIISNSLLYTKENNKIVVNCKRNNNNIILTIKDYGIGMKEEVLVNVRKPFFSYNDYGVENSVGLGLTVADKIINLHGGSIFINSSLYKGTTITLNIPIIKNTKNISELNTKYESYIKNRFSPIYITLSDIAILPI